MYAAAPPSSMTHSDEFWDYDHQADLEAFSSRQLYQELADQSHRVVAAIGNQKEQVIKCVLDLSS